MSGIASSIKLSRHNLELVYSIILLILIPGLMVANTLVANSATKKDLDRILNNEAESINSVLVSSAKDIIDRPEELQDLIDEILEQDDLITKITFLKPGSGDFKVVASSDPELVDVSINDPRFATVNLSSRSVAGITRSADGTRSTSVVSAVKIGTDTVGMVVTDVSIASADEIINKTFNRSLILLVVTVVVVASLLTNHFRFVEYAQLTKKLEEADRLKTDFLNVATHELKAPMSAVKGNVANVLDGTFGEVNDQIKTSLSTAVKETDRLTNLVQDLLNVSRIEQGKISFNLASVNPASVIQPILDSYAERAKTKGLTINYLAPDEPINMLVDEGRYQEIMTNLIDNAWKYSLQGEITIRHEIKDKTITTRVKDTGIGLSAQERDNLFQRFYRARNDQTKEIGGTGLGLWIIKQYIEKMNGTISVDSLQGVGSEFIVELPKSQ